jgi:hypothetical protein
MSQMTKTYPMVPLSGLSNPFNYLELLLCQVTFFVTGYLFPLSLIVFLYSVMLYRLLRNVGYLQILYYILYNKKIVS